MPEEKRKVNPETSKMIGEIFADALEKILPLISEGAQRKKRAGLPYDCTGEEFKCSTYYICDNNNHSCRTDTSFGCGGTFDCTGGAFGIVVL